MLGEKVKEAGREVRNRNECLKIMIFRVNGWISETMFSGIGYLVIMNI